VREDRVVFLDAGGRYAGALGFASALGLTWLLENGIAPLAAAVDGDRATVVRQPG
jgi:hypothetical protein